MADLHSTFIEFDGIIKLSSTKKNSLRTSRDAIRDDIKKYFRENRDKHTVGSKGQGSFMMNTIIQPIAGEYDVDDGVYIFGKEEDRPSVYTAHNWILKAVENRTNSASINKNTCVRVIYKGDYHVDLPIYFKANKTEKSFFDNDDIPELAHLTKGWIESDPYAFNLWFDEKAKNKPQLKRIVRYLKAWSDKKQNDNSSFRFPSGMIFTILACNYLIENTRDDVALLETLKKIQVNIDDRKFISASYNCYRPTVDANENLLDKYSAETIKNNFLDALDSFIKSGEQAIVLDSKMDACAKWQRHLGNRFPCSSITEDKSKSSARIFSNPDQINFDNKSA